MGRLIKGKRRKFNGVIYTRWTREGRKVDAQVETLTLRRKGWFARFVKADGAAGRAGFWDVYKRRKPKARVKGIKKKKF